MVRDFPARRETGPMPIESQSQKTGKDPDRWTLIRDVAVLQVKLVVDGMRDFILVPVSLVAGLISLIRGETGPESPFYELLRFGKKSEHWINLFSAASHVHGTAEDDERFRGDDIDELVSKAESFVVDEYRRGGLTAQSREKLGRVFKAIHQRLRNRKG